MRAGEGLLMNTLWHFVLVLSLFSPLYAELHCDFSFITLYQLATGNMQYRCDVRCGPS